MKQGKHYFDLMPKDIQDRFKANFIEQHNEEKFEEYLGLEFDNHDSFIGGYWTPIRMNWYESKESSTFWVRVSNQQYDLLKAAEPIQPHTEAINNILIGTISEEKDQGLEAYVNATMGGGTFDELDKEIQSMVLTVIKGAYTMGWIDCKYTCIKKLSE